MLKAARPGFFIVELGEIGMPSEVSGVEEYPPLSITKLPLWNAEPPDFGSSGGVEVHRTTDSKLGRQRTLSARLTIGRLKASLTRCESRLLNDGTE